MRTFPFELRRRPSALPLAMLVLITLMGSVLVTNAQSEAPAKPAATGTTPPEKSSPKASPTPPLTGTIRGRLTATDSQPLMNANVMVQSLSGAPVAKPARPD
ncbi:MAG TPA: hypothetical protein VMS31_21585, partial [Pyrinomonadaceae bacterium]|nr:hypothetical protein [Pyrinomonadaceae bacterium]